MKGVSPSKMRAMATLNTDYASKAQTCGSDTDVSDSTVNRHVNTGLGQTAKKVVGLKWRSPDVSERWMGFVLRNSPNHLVCRLPSLADVQIIQGTSYGH